MKYIFESQSSAFLKRLGIFFKEKNMNPAQKCANSQHFFFFFPIFLLSAFEPAKKAIF